MVGPNMRSCLYKIINRLAPPVTKGEKIAVWERLLILWLFVLGIGLFLFLIGIWSIPPWLDSAIHMGLYCPGCGGSRALNHLMQGEILLAMRHNLLFVLSLPLLIYSGIILLRSLLFAYPLTRLFIHPIGLWLMLSVIVLFTVLRNIPAPALDFLRPPR